MNGNFFLEREEPPSRSRLWRILIPLLVCAVLIAAGVLLHAHYSPAAKLCEQIAAGETVSTDLGNALTAPRFLSGFLLKTGREGVRIPLIEACRRANRQAIEVLLANGADPDYSFAGYFTGIEAVLHSGADNETKKELIKLLLAHGADPNASASYDPPVIDQAALLQTTEQRDLAAREEMILFLLSVGADPTDPETGSTVLHYAVRGGDKAFLAELIDTFRLPLNDRNYLGMTPLMCAVLTTNSALPLSYAAETASFLLEKGADATLRDMNGRTVRELVETRELKEFYGLFGIEEKESDASGK